MRSRTSTRPRMSTRERRRARTRPRRRDVHVRVDPSASRRRSLPAGAASNAPPCVRDAPGVRRHNPTPSTSSRARTTPAIPRLAPDRPRTRAMLPGRDRRPPPIRRAELDHAPGSKMTWIPSRDDTAARLRERLPARRGDGSRMHTSRPHRAPLIHSHTPHLSPRAAHLSHLSSSLSAATPSRFGLLSAIHSTTSFSAANP